VVLFLDDDIDCPPDLLRHHLAAHERCGDLVTSGPIQLARDSPDTLIARAAGEWYTTFAAVRRVTAHRTPSCSA
jgi:GT2 family glycosyltransferase